MSTLPRRPAPAGTWPEPMSRRKSGTARFGSLTPEPGHWGRGRKLRRRALLALQGLLVARRALEGGQAGWRAAARPLSQRGGEHRRGADRAAEEEGAEALAPVLAVHDTILRW